MKKDVPEIVANLSFLNQSGQFSGADVYTPSIDGLFRISIYCDYSPSVVDGNFFTFGVPVFWSDDFGQLGGLTTAPLAGGAGPHFHAASGLTFMCKLKANQPVSLGASSQPPDGTSYNIYAVVEDLN